MVISEAYLMCEDFVKQNHLWFGLLLVKSANKIMLQRLGTVKTLRWLFTASCLSCDTELLLPDDYSVKSDRLLNRQ